MLTLCMRACSPHPPTHAHSNPRTHLVPLPQVSPPSSPSIAVGVRITNSTPRDGALEIEKLRAHLDEANSQIILGVVVCLIREAELVAANCDLRETLLEAAAQVVKPHRAAEAAEAESVKARAEATELAAKRLAGGEVPVPGSLLHQFKLMQDRGKAEKEARRTAESLAADRLGDFKASRALLLPLDPRPPHGVPNSPQVVHGVRRCKGRPKMQTRAGMLAPPSQALREEYRTRKACTRSEQRARSTMPMSYKNH